MSDELERAINLIRSGDKRAGRQLLAQVLRAQPQNETAWLWMSNVVDTDEQRRDCLERVLAIDPENHVTKRGPVVLWSKQEDEARPVETVEPTASPPPATH